MRKLLTAIIPAMVLALVAVTANAADLKIGLLDLPMILQKAPQVNAINQKLKDQFAPQQQQIMNLQNKLRGEMQKLNAQDGTKLSDNDRKKLQDTATADQKQLQEMVVSFQDKANQAQNAAMQQFMTEINDTSKTVANKQGLDVVLLKPAVIYASNTVDITQQVLDQLPKK